MSVNPIEGILSDRSEELDRARTSIDGSSIRALRSSLANPYRLQRRTNLGQADLGELIGLSGSHQAVSGWENNQTPISDDHLLIIHRIRGVIDALPQLDPAERYLFLLNRQEGLLAQLPVSPIELLRMPTQVGYQAIISFIEVSPPDPRYYQELLPTRRKTYR